TNNSSFFCLTLSVAVIIVVVKLELIKLAIENPNHCNLSIYFDISCVVIISLSNMFDKSDCILPNPEQPISRFIYPIIGPILLSKINLLNIYLPTVVFSSFLLYTKSFFNVNLSVGLYIGSVFCLKANNSFNLSNVMSSLPTLNNVDTSFSLSVLFS